MRTLPRAESAYIKLLTRADGPPQQAGAFDSATAYYRYRTLSLPPYRGEVVATISDFNTLSGSLRLLVFTAANHWVSTCLLATHYDEAGAREDLLSVQRTPTTFWQQKLAGGVKELPPKKAGDPSRYVGNEYSTTHYLLQFRAGKFTQMRLDSTYRLTKE